MHPELSHRMEIPGHQPSEEGDHGPSVVKVQTDAQQERQIKRLRVETVLFFNWRKNHVNGRTNIVALNGRGIRGLEGMPIFEHRESDFDIYPGLQLVEFETREFDAFAFAKPVKDKRKIHKVIEDLLGQKSRVLALDDESNFNREEYNPPAEVLTKLFMPSQEQEEYVPPDWTAFAVLDFEVYPSRDEETSLMARYGAGYKARPGTAMFGDYHSPISIQEGWQLVEVQLWEDRKYGLALACTDCEAIDAAVKDLSNQITRISR